MSLHVPSFGGGVVRLGSPDTQQTDELLQADSLDIGPRGQLVAASDLTDYTLIGGASAGNPQLPEVYALASIQEVGSPFVLLVGEGLDATATTRSHYMLDVPRSGVGGYVAIPLFPAVVVPVSGSQVSIVQFPGVYTVAGAASSLIMICVGARESQMPKTALGLVAFQWNNGASTRLFYKMSDLDGLGTGPSGATFPTGTKGKPLFFRGIVGYNNHVFGWGYDSADATNGNGPNRVMFSNVGDPRKWGNDNVAASGDRDFTDSDAIVLGDAGEIIRAALKWSGRLYFGTNQQLHYLGGFGRDSFLTDGANPVAKSYNVIGLNALIEGPDRLMYGVADQGLWSYDGATVQPLFKKLIDFAGHSPGYWDLIWTDESRSVGYPGRTNQDLVWMAVDWDREQVLVGIPFCNATTGAGVGTDTVVIKYHPRTGGFTRQVFSGVAYTCAAYLRREGQQREVKWLATGTAGSATVRAYGYQATPTTAPVLPTRLPVVTFGPYAPFGPDGDGVVRRAYLTLAWEAAGSLPLVFQLATTVDAAPLDSFLLSVQATAPGAPANGDVWVDTSQSDTNLGNATGGTLVQATGGYLVKTWDATASLWRLIPGSGEQGTRARIPLPLTRRTGARLTITATCTSAAGRFQWEGLGLNPGSGSHDA